MSEEAEERKSGEVSMDPQASHCAVLVTATSLHEICLIERRGLDVHSRGSRVR